MEQSKEQQHEEMTTTTSSQLRLIADPSSSARNPRQQTVSSKRRVNADSGSSTMLQPDGFVNGDFMSGILRQVDVQDKCFTTAYQSSSCDEEGLLAVGTTKGVALYETVNYTRIQLLERGAMVSSLEWIQFLDNRRNWLLVVADVKGCVTIYHIDTETVESPGPTLLTEWTVHAEVRAVSAVWIGFILVVGVGDKKGKVTLTEFDPLFPANAHRSVILQEHDSAVLGMALTDKFQAITTEAGMVVVHDIRLLQSQGNVNAQERQVFVQQRSGPVRAATFSPDSQYLAVGGYDKRVVLIDTEQWAVARELHLQGTVNTIAFDPDGWYVGVGCRDKTFTIFDTSTYRSIKTFHTTHWVTSINWMSRGQMAIRSAPSQVSILDLSPIHQTSIRLTASVGTTSVSWSPDGRWLARTVGSCISVVDATSNFCEVLSSDLGQGTITKVAFCPVTQHDGSMRIATVSESGNLSILGFNDNVGLELKGFVQIEPHLKALAWSHDGALLATGGRKKLLHVFTSHLKPKGKSVLMQGRIWDIEFVPKNELPLMLAVALGDYTTLILNTFLEPVLQIPRIRTCRCLGFHPFRPILAIGDGAATVAVVDYEDEEVVREIDVGGRVNDVEFNSAGDFLVVATDDSRYGLYESKSFQCVQEIPSLGFALVASFSPSGLYLALGSANGDYSLVQLGPLLGTNLIPLTLEGGTEHLPPWALQEALYRSGDGPSFVQRHMIKGGSDNLQRVATILREYPCSIYTFNRSTKENCFDTALALNKPNLVKLAVTTLCDGTLDPRHDGEKNFLTTDIPMRGRETLLDIVENYPPDFIVDILKKTTFMKVPFTGPRMVKSGDRLECGSDSYTDPWSDKCSSRNLIKKGSSSKVFKRGGIMRTPAVLPLPGLGDKDFLAGLLAHSPADAFDNDAMAVVLRVLWVDHIQRYYYLDCFVFVTYYASWIVLVEQTSFSESPSRFDSGTWMALAVTALNSIFTIKELVEARFGRRKTHWRSIWNWFDLVSLLAVYAYTGEIMIRGEALLPLGVVTSLLLTVKLISYLRGFADTGWLVSVLTANFRDVRGFLIILFSILVGFSVAFRVLFGDLGDESWSSLRRAFLSTFELTITGSYDSTWLYDSEYRVLAVFTFILAVTCVLVVALNALISILADSYAKVQENAVANRRRELATLVVEYMSLLPPWKRRQIEKEARWFHTLLEVDADGSLQVQSDDWEGGLNALRRDMEELSQTNRETNRRALEQLKSDLDVDITKFKNEIVSMLEDLADDVKFLRKVQSSGIAYGAKQNLGKAVGGAVKTVGGAVKSVGRKGGALFKGSEVDDDVKSTEDSDVS